jgi:hypothetical protein
MFQPQKTLTRTALLRDNVIARGFDPMISPALERAQEERVARHR